MTGKLSRRTTIRLAGTAGVLALAGCGGPGEEDDTVPEEPADDTDNDEPAEDIDVEEWEEVDEFFFEGRTSAWTGVEPDIIEGDDNPTITLIEGQEYDFGWVNADGATHNLEIRDEGGEIIDDYESDTIGDEGEEAWIEGVEASTDMVTYICRFHESTQVGDIEVVSE